MSGLHHLRVVLGAAGLLGVILAARVVAQDPAPPPGDLKPAQAAAQESKGAQPASESRDDSVMGLILQSGASGVGFMVVLGLFSLVGATVAIERAFNTRRSRIIPPRFVEELDDLIRARSAPPEDYRELCTRWSAPIATILRAGLTRCGRPIPEVEKAMEDAAARETATLRGGIRPLTVVGNIAPLVGLLGTVLGMIVAFRTASQAGLGKGELMAQGIYLALLTTAAGLMIAIPALVLAAFFTSKVDKSLREIDARLMETIPWFARQEPARRVVSGDGLDDTIREPEALAIAKG